MSALADWLDAEAARELDCCDRCGVARGAHSGADHIFRAAPEIRILPRCRWCDAVLAGDDDECPRCFSLRRAYERGVRAGVSAAMLARFREELFC